jgi:hypothetical protein
MPKEVVVTKFKFLPAWYEGNVTKEILNQKEDELRISAFISQTN